MSRYSAEVNDINPPLSAMTRHLLFFVFADFQLLDVSGPMAAFEMANRIAPGSYRWTVCSRASALGHHMGSSPSTRTRSSSDHAVALRFMRKLILPFFPIGTGRTKFSTIFFNNDRFCGA